MEGRKRVEGMHRIGNRVRSKRMSDRPTRPGPWMCLLRRFSLSFPPSLLLSLPLFSLEMANSLQSVRMRCLFLSPLFLSLYFSSFYSFPLHPLIKLPKPNNFLYLVAKQLMAIFSALSQFIFSRSALLISNPIPHFFFAIFNFAVWFHPQFRAHHSLAHFQLPCPN